MDKKRILVVEDEDEMRTVIALELETSGYDVFQAKDGEMGFKLAMEKRPDLIISDVLMPKMDGNQLMKKLRETEFGQNIPFIVLTARGQMQDYFEVRDAADFIAKPFEAEDLLARVKKALDKSGINLESEVEAAAAAETSGPKKKILILEDEIRVYLKIEETLTRHGYKVKVVNTVTECLGSAILFKPDLILLRYLLEGMNADKLVKIIKDTPQTNDVPCIVYSKETFGGEDKSVLEAGAACFVGEESEDQILKAVQEVLSEQEQ